MPFGTLYGPSTLELRSHERMLHMRTVLSVVYASGVQSELCSLLSVFSVRREILAKNFIHCILNRSWPLTYSCNSASRSLDQEGGS